MNGPTRKIGPSRISLTGLFFSTKNNRQIQFESSLELDFAEILEHDDKIHTYIEQPTRIELDNGWYYPDFFVRFTNQSKLKHGLKNTFYEIKYTYEIEKKREYYSRRFDEITAKCNALEYEFEVVTEKDIRNEYLENIKMLNHYKNKSVDQIIYDMVLDQIALRPIFTPKEIQDSIPGGLYEKSHALFVVWYLLANKRLFTDLNSILNMETELISCDGRLEY